MVCLYKYVWLVIVVLVFYIVVFVLGMGLMFWMINFEIYFLWVCSIGNVFFIVINWICNFVILMIFFMLIEWIMCFGMFWFYGGIFFCGWLFFYIYFWEIKGKFLE